MTAQTTAKPTSARRTAKPKTIRARFAAWAKSERGRTFTKKWLPALGAFAVIFYISYGHIHTATLMAGGNATEAALSPIMVDCQMIVGAVWIDTAKSRAGRVFAFLTFGFGFLVSLAANVVATDPTIIGKVYGVTTAVSLFLAAGTLHWGPKRAKVKKPAVKATTVTATATVPSSHRRAFPVGRSTVATATEAPNGWGSVTA
jgi:hypothetical protein